MHILKIVKTGIQTNMVSDEKLYNNNNNYVSVIHYGDYSQDVGAEDALKI
jgi:hypothetical protein